MKNNIFWPLMKDTISFTEKLRLAYFVLTASRFTNGPKVIEFENAWNKWLGSNYSLFVSSGSTANFLLIAAVKELYGLENGDKVIVPACTWVTSVAPIMQLGLTPIFCDISLDNYCLDLDDLKIIKEKHPDIKMIFTTHLLGFHSDVEAIKEIFPDALIAEDCCESHGVLNNKSKRTSDCSLGMTFSFYYGHHMTTIEGGIVSTNNRELFELMRMKRSHGFIREAYPETAKKYKDAYPNIMPSFLFATDGYNFRNTELAAVLGISQLKKLNNIINIRNNNFRKYYELIASRPDLFYIPKNYSGISSFSLPFICRSQEVYDFLRKAFDDYKIEYRPVVGGNLLNQPFLKNFGFDYKKEVFNVDTLQKYGLYIGNNQYIGNKELKILEKILSGIK